MNTSRAIINAFALPLYAPSGEGGGGSGVVELSPAPAAPAGSVDTAGAAAARETGRAEAAATTQSADDELSAVFDRLQKDDGAEAAKTSPQRAADGRFAGTAKTGVDGAEPGADEASGAEADGAEAGKPSTVQADDPAALPANWKGREALWEKIPAELKAEIGAVQRDFHERASQAGRMLSVMQPVAAAIAENKDYFDGSRTFTDATTGEPITVEPAQAVKFLFQVQRSMDANPIGTLVAMAGRYGITAAKVIDALRASGGEGGAGDESGSGEGGDPQAAQMISELRSTNARLEARLSALENPDKVKNVVGSVLDERSQEAELDAFAGGPGKEHWEAVKGDLPFFIGRAAKVLGQAATRQQLLQKAYDLAVDADPQLRTKRDAAAAAAAQEDAANRDRRAADATKINVPSRGAGKARQKTEAEELGDIYDRASAR